MSTIGLTGDSHRRRRLRGTAVVLFAVCAAAALFRPSPALATVGLVSGCDAPWETPTTPPVVSPTTSVELDPDIKVVVDVTSATGPTAHKEFTPVLPPVWPNAPAPWQSYTVDVEGDGQADVRATLVLRFRDDATSILPLLSTTFGVPLDNPIGPPAHLMVGLDLVVETVAGGSFNAGVVTVGAGLKFVRQDGSWYKTRADFEFSSFQSSTGGDGGVPHPFPARSVTTFGYKADPAGWPNQGHWMLNLDNDYAPGIASPGARPPLRNTFHLYDVDETGTPIEETIRADLRWAHGPEQFAFGTEFVCGAATQGFQARSQLSWHQPQQGDGGALNPLQLAVKVGVGEGIGGHDEIEIDTGFSDVPEWVDLVFKPTAILFHRSAETPLDVDVRMLALATIDPTILLANMQEPLVLSGKITGAPEETVITHDPGGGDPSAPGGAVTREAVQFCPAANAVPGETIPPCTGDALPQAADVRLRIQNVFDGDNHAGLGLPDAPTTYDGDQSYVVYGSNDNRFDCTTGFCVLLRPHAAYRFAAHLREVRSAGVTLTTEGATNPTSKMHIEGNLGTEQETRVIVHLDSRTRRNDEVANRGNLVDVDAVVTSLPEQATIDYETGPNRPFRVATSFSSGVSSIDGKAAVRLAGPGATHVDGKFHAALVPETLNVDWTETLKTILLNGAPVPISVENKIAYSASSPTFVAAGMDVTDAADRAADLRTRVYVGLLLPSKLNVAWRQTPFGGALQEVEVRGCPPEAWEPVVEDCTDIVQAAVVRTTLSSADSDYLTEPPLPAAQPVGVVHPHFTAWNDQGVRAIVRSAKSWGVRARLGNVRTALYKASPQTFCLTAQSTASPFPLQFFDDSDTYNLYADVLLSQLPNRIGVRVMPDGGSGSQPWVWATTGNCLDMTTPPAKVTQNQDPASSPRIDAVVRYGDPLTFLGGVDHHGNRPAPQRLSGASGIEATLVTRAALGGGGAIPAAHAHVNEPVPDTFLLWEPGESRCDDTSPPQKRKTCQNRPNFEVDEWQRYYAKMWSSLTHLGPLDLLYTDGDAHRDVVVHVDKIPGRIEGYATLTENRRLPWTKIHTQLKANTGLGTAAVKVFDGADPAHYGHPGESAYAKRTANYSVILRNVPSLLVFDGEMYGSTEQPAAPRTVPAPKNDQVCGPGLGYTPPTTESSLGYVHADVDMGGIPTAMSLRMRDYGGGKLSAHLSSFQKISGTIAVRLNNIVDNGYSKKEHYDPLTGLIYLGSSEDWRCIDADLPLRIGFGGVRDLGVGLSKLRFSFSTPEDEPPAALTLWAGEDSTVEGDAAAGAFKRSGMWYRRFYHHFDPLAWGDWKVNETNWQQPSVHVFATPGCATVENECFYHNGIGTDVLSPLAYDGKSGGRAFRDVLVDIFFTSGIRKSMWERDIDPLEPGRPGIEFYSAALGAMPKNHNLTFPNVAPQATKKGLAVVSTGDCWPTIGAADAKGYGVKRDTKARGADGTRYYVRLQCRRETYGIGSDSTTRLIWDHLALEAEFDATRDYQPRWEAHLPDPVGMGYGGLCMGPAKSLPKCQISVFVTPSIGGSVQLTIVSTAQSGFKFSKRTDRVWLDASGVPGRAPSSDTSVASATAAKVTNFFPAFQAGTAGTPLAVDVCPPYWACATPPSGGTRRWYFGDGRYEGSSATKRSHTYPVPGSYLAKVVDYDKYGKVVAHHSIVVWMG